MVPPCLSTGPNTFTYLILKREAHQTKKIHEDTSSGVDKAQQDIGGTSQLA